MGRKILLILVFITMSSYSSLAQSYLGYTSKKTELRDCPLDTCEVLITIKKNSIVFLFSLQTDSGYYHVIDIKTNTEGYIAEDDIQSIEVLPESPGSIFQPKEKTVFSHSLVKIVNDTKLPLTLRLNATKYTFYNKEEQTLSLSPGKYTFYASAPGVIPNYGTVTFEKNVLYEWIFYIVKEIRKVYR